METSSEDEELRRKAASLWYERFERRREERQPSAGRRRWVQLLMLATAALLVVGGLFLRGEKLRRTGGGTDPAELSATLSRELELDKAGGQRFFPLWEEWSRREAEIAKSRGELLAGLDKLAAQHSDVNQEQQRLLEELAGLDSLRQGARRVLLDEVRRNLGLWRAARLAVLLDAPPE